MSRFAMLFPGQASQSVGMLSDLAARYPVIGETYAEASEALGYDMAALIADGPAEKLNETEYTQPAIVAASTALWRLWQSEGGPAPAFVAGHSLGEYSALVAAGVLDFSDALRLTRLRGQAMQTAVGIGEGAMAAVIGLDDEVVRHACVEAEAEHAGDGLAVSPANYNAPSQVVIAGHTAAVTTASRIAKEKGAKLVRPLAMSVPSHCALMIPAAERLQAHLAEMTLHEPQITVLHDVDAQPHADVDDIRQALVRQLSSAVLWVDIVRTIHQSNCALFIECGPGKVLAGLNKRIDKSARCLPLSVADTLESAIAETVSAEK